jgi:putative SOS response-associated peptidase YedK
MFRSAFKRTRCIVPASGYYEWRTVEKSKQPYFISAADGSVLSIAGLWDQWKDPATGETISSATLIITASNDFTRPIHERMPVFLGQEDHDTWLTGKAGVEMLRSAPNDLLRMWPVSIRVNKSGQGDDDPGLIEAIEDEVIGGAKSPAFVRHRWLGAIPRQKHQALVPSERSTIYRLGKEP